MINSHHKNGITKFRLSCSLWFCLLVASSYATLILAADDYKLGGGDTVKIIVYQQPDLATVANISQDDGTINFPLLGEVTLGGLSAEEAGDKIERLLRDGGFIKEPQVAVTVQEFQSQKIPILGQVSNPGEYPLRGENKLVDLITKAGGLRPDAADIVIVVKNEGGKSVKREIDLSRFYAGDMTQNIIVEEGDFILVPKMDTFYVHGEVKAPGKYRLERGMTVMQAISVGGGVTGRGSLKRLIVTRRQEDGKTNKVDVDLLDTLKPNDVLYVKERLF